MYGCRPKLPIDYYFPYLITNVRPISRRTYVQKLKVCLNEAFCLIDQLNTKEMEWQKRHYDRKCKAAQLAPGNLVLLKKDAVVGRPKLQDRWSEELYQVMDCKADNTLVYVITSTKTGNEKVVHWNMLLVVQLMDSPSESQAPRKE